MVYNKKTIGLVALLTTGMLAFSAYVIATVPADAQLPIHWNASGEVDGYTSPLVAMLVLPVAAVVTSLLMLVIPKLEVRRQNLAQSHKLLAVSWIGTTLLLTLLHGGIGLIGLGYPVPFMALIYVGMGLLFAAIGNVFGKSRSNHHAGIRKPWTLASDAVCDKTHRLAGRLWVLAGLLMIVSGLFLQPVAATIVVVLVALSGALIPIIASYYFWRQEQAGSINPS